MNTRKAFWKNIFSRAKPFFMNENKKYSQYEIGEWTYGNPRVISWHEGTTLKIGRFCSISRPVTILLGGEHRIDWVTTYPFSTICAKAKKFLGHPHSQGNVIIENDVWIGTDVLILSGVTIGNGAVVAARSVVTEDVAPYSIIGGNPAKLIRYRFKKSIIKELERIAWWNWPLSKIEEAWPLLLSSNIEAFIATYKT